MSHDLRTPLTAIIGYLQLLEKEPISDHQQKYLTTAYQRANHLKKLIDNFFSLSRVDAAEQPLNINQINLTGLVQEVIFTFYDQFQELSLEPQFNLTEESIFVLADETATYRVVENIVLNALQHSTLHGQVSPPNFYVQLKVKENNAVFSITNSLIDESVDETKVFQRFYTSDHSRHKKGGLGLTIVKHLMAQMGGDVEVSIKKDLFTITCYFKRI